MAEEKSTREEFDFRAYLQMVFGMLANDRATAFWETVFESTEPMISDPVRHMLRAAYRKRATLNRAQARTGDLFEEDAKGTLNISFEPVAFNKAGEIYIERRPSLAEKPDEPHPNRQAGMGVVIDHYEKPENAWARVVKKFDGARIIQAVPVPLDGILPRHVFDPDRGPFVLHVIAVYWKESPTTHAADFLPAKKCSSWILLDRIGISFFRRRLLGTTR